MHSCGEIRVNYLIILLVIAIAVGTGIYLWRSEGEAGENPQLEIITCPACKGRGRIDCLACEGGKDGIPRFYGCARCGSEGSFECHVCKGAGKADRRIFIKIQR